MNSMKGKSTITNFILLILVAFGVFALVKHLGANFTASSIAKTIKDRIGVERGADFTPEKGEQFIREILAQNDVIFDERDEDGVEVYIDTERQVIEYYFRYEMEVNFLIFTQRRVFEVEDEMPSYY